MAQTELSVDKFTLVREYPKYTATDDDLKKVAYVRQRFLKMQQARSIVDRNRDTYQTMVNAYFTPYPDERSSSTVPLASAIIELFVADAIKIKTIFQFKGETEQSQTNAKALEYVWKYDRRKNNREKVFTKSEYIAAAFGTDVIFSGYEEYEREQRDPQKGKNGEVEFVEKKFTQEKIIVKNVDIRNFFVDNQAIEGIEDASDCIRRQYLPFEEFEEKKGNSAYKNIEFVVPKQFNNDYKTFVTAEETVRQGDFVEEIHYRNKRKDMYVVVANNVIIREQPMISTIAGIKELPFTVRILGQKNYSIRGRGLCEGLLMFNTELNNLREMLMDGIRRSNSSVIAIGNGLAFDGKSFAFDNEILTFDGQLGGNFQQISGTPPNQAIFEYLTQIYKDIAIFIGIDVQNILGEPQQTAYQTEVQREASQKRINVWLKNRDLAYERFANLYKDLLQLHAPTIYKTIQIEDEALVDGEPVTSIDENGKQVVTPTQKFQKKPGKSMFEVTPELLRGDIYVDVYTNTNAPTINVVDRQQKMDLLQNIATIAQGYALAQQAGIDMEAILPMKQTLRDLVSDYNLEPQTKGNDEQKDVAAAKKALFDQIAGMKMGQAPSPDEQKQKAIEQIQPAGQANPLPTPTTVPGGPAQLAPVQV